ncbi:MAG: gamma carbonic anhydrase family protein [Opitutae bacterium]|nr:gamma carbonic anhydrase family protein [Opitutae bacterium]MBT5717179.1 gamma carbonic anhydrase family protein [Opitutae bacterium]
MNVKSRLGNFLSKQVSLGEGAWVAPNATLVGDVRVGIQSSVWYQCVLRGDINYIEIGRFSNLQDGVIGHLSDDYPLIVGDYVTVGHGAIIHACRIEDECLVGMNATILDGAVIGRQSIIAAGAVVPAGMVVPAGSLVAGVPGEMKRLLSAEKRESLKGWAEKYLEVTKAHRNLKPN